MSLLFSSMHQLARVPRYTRAENWPLRRSSASSRSYGALDLGFVNLMPDLGLVAAERQFLRLVAVAARNIHCRLSFFKVGDYAYQSGSAVHFRSFYQPAPQSDHRLDALIVTGTTPTRDRLEDEPFWDDLRRLVDWAAVNVRSTLFSCLSSHAALAHLHGIERYPLKRKLWGVYPHQRVEQDHPLAVDAGGTIMVPHSRYYCVGADALKQAGLRVVISGDGVGAHLVTSADGLRFVFQQGHPEYGSRTMLRELLRDAGPSSKGTAPGQLPENYFPRDVELRLREDRQFEETGRLSEWSRLMLNEIAARLETPWRDAATSMTHAWLRSLVPPSGNADEGLCVSV